MKARAGKTTFDNLNPELRKQLEDMMQQRLNDEWSRVQAIASERFMYGLALTLNDKLGYRDKGIKMILDALGEILVGYSEDTYTPKEDREGTKELERMTEAMKAELVDRGITLEWD